ncbi:putative Type II CAAX prenyl endopeptidase Rce1 [Septoria linicola]|nr:putative Type II CAAX prenyl endopeptidase Rce1 [Septoria linicola]
MPPPPISNKANKVLQGGYHFLGRIRDYYFGAKERPPAISERTALLLGLLFTAFFVAPFYLSATLRATPLNSRDAPAVIKARVRAVGLSCIASTVVAVYVLVSYGHANPRDVLRLFAIWPVNLIDCAKTLALLSVLFIGPLYETILVDSGWRQWNLATIKENFFTDLRGLRNHVVAPWAEEWVFRSLVVSLYLLAKVSPMRIVFTTPLIFGAAHIHHLVEFVSNGMTTRQKPALRQILLVGLARSFFQFTYTSLFGFFAAFLYLRTGNVFAAIIAHMFCNFMGFPRVVGRVGQAEEDEAYGMTPDVAQGKRDDSVDCLAEGNSLMHGNHESKSLAIWWSVVYYLLLFVGSYGFYKLLWPLTASSNSLASFQ